MKKEHSFQGLGRRVQQLRKASGLSQEELAQAIGKTVNTVSNIERGLNSTRLNTIGVIADTFGVRVADLFEEPGPATSKDQERRREVAKLIAELDTCDAETVRHVRGLIRSALEIRKRVKSRRITRT